MSHERNERNEPRHKYGLTAKAVCAAVPGLTAAQLSVWEGYGVPLPAGVAERLKVYFAGQQAIWEARQGLTPPPEPDKI